VVPWSRPGAIIRTSTRWLSRSWPMTPHSAVFAEVRVDEQLGVIRVARIVSAIAAGRILNPKTARSQIIGGVVWGIGMALHEETLVDHAFGRIMNANYAEYPVPVNADVPDIEVIFVDEPDHVINPLGIKGVGEIGIVGVAAAIANAVYNATGKRVRSPAGHAGQGAWHVGWVERWRNPSCGPDRLHVSD
jgi:CO/xanthine dehydrogenase Mo-binding subunit